MQPVDADPVVDRVGRDAEPHRDVVDGEAAVYFLGQRAGAGAGGVEVS